MKDPISIVLDSETVILRNIGDEEAEPATLSGRVVLDLHSRAEIYDITLAFSGGARITYTDIGGSYKTHTMDVPVFFHDQSFLPSFDDVRQSAPASIRTSPFASRQGSSATLSALGDHPAFNPPHSPLSLHGTASASNLQDYHVHTHPDKHAKHHPHHHHHHTHTFNQGLHTFPFTLTIPGSLPASIRANNASSLITYQLKASATRAGALGFGGKWSVKKPVNIIRGLLPDAAEYNQTLEIENTWPGKIMYNITLPHKAFVAGENIPVALKFTPIAKGVKVTQLVTTIRENIGIVGKDQQVHNMSRDIATKKHNFHARSSRASTTSSGAVHPVTAPPSRNGSHTDLANMVNHSLNLQDHPLTASAPRTRESPSTSSPFTIGGPSGSSSASGSAANSRAHSRPNSPERIYYGRSNTDPDFAGAVDEEGTEDVDIDAVIEIPIPISVTPTHPIEPVNVTHKIKWSAYIRNLDGHTSELRCALPVYILHPALREEALLASSGTRSLLFGPSGVLVPAAEGIQQVDLPSYSDHVKDRVANIDDSSTGGTLATQNSLTTNASFVRSPWATPHASPHLSPVNDSGGYFPEHPRPINWADSELLSSLSMAPSGSQQGAHSGPTSSHSSLGPSPATSRPGSRPSSRPSSRPTSRASSPVRGQSTNGDAMGMQSHPSPSGDAGHTVPGRTTSAGILGGFHLPKPLKAFTSLGSSSHSSSGTGLADRVSSSGHLPGILKDANSQHASSGHYSPRHDVSGPPQAPQRNASQHDVAAGVSAALEAHQARQAGQSKGKGKKRATFAVMDDDDHDPDHDDDHDHDHHGDSADHSHDHSPYPETEEDASGRTLLSQVPSYEVARRGFLGGGAPPLSVYAGLPSYDESEHQSHPDLPRMGSAQGNT